MTQDFESNELDAQIRRAMQRRPEPVFNGDLAARAVAKASAVVLPMRKLNRVRRWSRLLTAVAVMLMIGLSVWIVETHLKAGGFQTWSLSSLMGADTSTTYSTDSSTVSDTATDWAFVGAMMSVAAIILVMIFKALSVNDEPLVGWGRTTARG